MSDQIGFDDLESANDFENDDDSYDFENWSTVNFDDESEIVGRLEAALEDIGKYDSMAYLINDDGRKRLVWGNGSIDAAFEDCDAEEGDMFGVRKTGETYTNDYGTFDQYEVRYLKA